MKKLRVCIVEDSKFLNNVIKKELTKIDIDVAQAFSFKEAEELLAKEAFDYIILDLHLPDGEGYELVEQIQSLTKTKVIVLTSVTDNELREYLFELGVLDYILKDSNLLYSIKEIIRIIEHVESKEKDRVLVVDDSKFLCKQIRRVLEPRNYLIDTAYSVNEALNKIEENREYNLILLDINLPDGSGVEVLKRVRATQKTVQVPIIVITGTLDQNLVKDLLKFGANDVMKKPFIYEELTLKVDMWVDYYKKDRVLEETNKKLAKYLELEKKISKQKDLIIAEQSRHAQMGELIAIIAHQWRQPLNVLFTSCSVAHMMIQNSPCANEKYEELFAKVMRQIQYMDETIEEFRNFFKPQKMVQTDFEKIVQKALKLLDSIKVADVKIDVEVKEVVSFEAYENDLVQVVLSLINNAIEALVERSVKEPKIKIVIDGRRLIVRDNAGGIDEAIIDKIFEPYFSTKGAQGTGLGLYMASLIVGKHPNSTLSVRNGQEGAEFVIEIGA